MPQKIICSNCSEVLYEGELLKSPLDLIKKFEGKCPSCGKSLEFNVDNINILTNQDNS